MPATADAELGFIPDKAQDLGFVPDKPNSLGFVPDIDSYGDRNDGNFSVEAPAAAPLVNGLVSTPLNLGSTPTTATGAPPATAVPALASTIVPSTNQQPAMGARIINAAAPPSPAQATQTAFAPSNLNNALNTPLWSYLPSDMKSALNPADFMREVSAKNPSEKFFSALAGSASGLGNTAQAFTSPLALSMFPMAGVSPAAQKAIGVAFGAQMIVQNPDIGTQLGEEMGKPADQRDTAKIAQLITEGFANSTLAGLMAKHALPDVGFKPDVVAQETTPASSLPSEPALGGSEPVAEPSQPATIADKGAANPTAPITLADLAQLQQEMRNNQGAALLKSKEVVAAPESRQSLETTAPKQVGQEQQPQSADIHGGAQEDLPAAQQAQSIANNSPDAWAQMRAATEAGKQSPTSRPGVENTKNAPESKQNSVQPVADTAETPAQSESGTHGIAARVLEARATAGDIEPIEAGEGISPQASAERGRELLRQAKDPLASFSDLTANRPLSDQVAIARARSEQIQKAADAAYDKSGADSAEYKAAKQANQDWAEQTKTLATESHKAMMAHQGEVDLNTGDFHALRQAHLEATGRDFEPAQEKKARAIADESKQSDSDVEKAKSKLYETIDRTSGATGIHSDFVSRIAKRIGDKLDSRADAARERIRQRFDGSLNADVSGAKAITSSLASLRDEIEIGASHIYHLGEDFAEWSSAMLKELGDRIKPDLKQIFAASQNLIDEEGDKEGGERPTAVKRAVRRKSSNPVSDALDAANKTVREAAARLAESEIKTRTTKSSETNKLAKVQEELNRKALSVAKKIAADTATRAADEENRSRIESAKKPNPSAIQERESQRALTEASRVARNAAANLAKEELKQKKAASDAAKKSAQVQVDAAKKISDMLNKRARDAAIRAAESDYANRILKANKPAYVWKHVRENYLDKGENDFGKMVNGASVDLGMTKSEIRTALTQPKGAKVLSDEMYGKMAERSRIQNSAKSWLKEQQQNTILKYGGKIPKAFFNAKVIGHGTVGMITHAGNQMFDPRAAKDYWTNFIRQYPMAFGKSGAYHEMMMEDLQHHPLYNKAKRAGLVIDPHKFADDYQTAPMIKYFGQIGNRGFDALKLYRMARFTHEWDNLPASLKTKEMASLIADSVNHSTGVVKASIPKGLQSTATTLLFAPKLEASRWMFAVADPARAAGTVANWRNATPEMKRQAMSEVKQKAVMIGTYFAALAANQGLLSAMGSNQKVNFTDPKKQDWLDFKVVGHNVGIVSPFKSMVRLFSKELHAVFGKRSNFEKLQGDRLDQAGSAVESYGRGKLSPFAGAVADSIARHDYAGNTLPWSNEKPKYKDSTHLAYGQYAAHQFLPIPLEDGMKEVWASQGMGDSMAKTALKAVLTAAAVGGTGARVTDDVQK